MSIIDELISGTSPECFKYILETEIAKQNEILIKVIKDKKYETMGIHAVAQR